jgi:hypothetical protein
MTLANVKQDVVVSREFASFFNTVVGQIWSSKQPFLGISYTPNLHLYPYTVAMHNVQNFRLQKVNHLEVDWGTLVWQQVAFSAHGSTRTTYNLQYST